MEQELLELQAEIKASQESRANLEREIAELKKSVETPEQKASSLQQVAAKEKEIVEMKAAMETLNTKFEAIKLEKGEQKGEFLPLGEAIAEVIESKNFKENHVAGRHKGASQEYEVKASTATIITPHVNTQVDTTNIFRPTRALAFFDNIRKATFDQDKNTLVWLGGEYASEISYIGEGMSAAKGDDVNVSEESRGVAKVSAKLKITEEMREDTSYVASQLENQMATRAMLWLDKELYSGDGTDGDAVKKKHIYGLQTHATAFSATKAGIAAQFDAPTLTELTSAVKLQGQMIDVAVEKNADEPGYDMNIVYINPIDAMVWRHTKDKNGQYIIQRLADGTDVMNGMRVVETKAVKANTLFAMDSSIPTLWMKRNPVLKFGQEQDDFSTDQYTYVMFIRLQLVVKSRDTKGLIYVSDIKAALASLEKPTV